MYSKRFIILLFSFLATFKTAECSSSLREFWPTVGRPLLAGARAYSCSNFLPINAQRILRSTYKAIDQTYRPELPHKGSIVQVVEVAARDNLQNAQRLDGTPIDLSPAQRGKYIEEITKCRLAGVPLKLEAGSFVPARWVPQMAKIKEVYANLPYFDPYEHLTVYSFLAVNDRSMDDILDEKEKRSDSLRAEVAVAVSATEAFAKSNFNSIVDEITKRALRIMERAKDSSFLTRAYISMYFGDPRGTLDPVLPLQIVRQFNAAKCDEIVLCDTAGIASPKSVYNACSEATRVIDYANLALHLHVHENKAEEGLKNALAGMLAGIRVFDAGNLRLDPKKAVVKGCPYSPGAPRNIETVALLELFKQLGIKTNWNLEAVRALRERGLDLG